jgi:hypothetical protein
MRAILRRSTCSVDSSQIQRQYSAAHFRVQVIGRRLR